MPASDSSLTHLRLRAQSIERAGRSAKPDPAGVVGRLCAMQAQDYAGALWSVGLRAKPGTLVADVERAIAERRIVRTWPMRGTLHFVDPADLRWMLELLSPRMIANAVGRLSRLGIAEADFAAARSIFEAGLSGGGVATRSETLSMLEAGGQNTEGQRGYHLLVGSAQRGVLCLGPMAGKQQTFTLLDEWVPPADEPPLDRPSALARLALRYFGGHGPATVADFAWWAGLNRTDARAGIEGAGQRLRRIVGATAEYWLPADTALPRPRGSRSGPAEPRVELLSGFDEYYLGYTDRSLQLGEHREAYASLVSANGVFWSTFMIDGVTAGTWRRVMRARTVDVTVRPFRQLSPAEKTGLAEAIERFARFWGVTANATS